MDAPILTDDSLAIVLLCSRLAVAKRTGPLSRPLAIDEWNKIVKPLRESSWQRPRALLGQTAAALREELAIDADLAERAAALLERGGQVAIELERLASRGIWALTRADNAYPARLKQRLKEKAPPVLFGAGPVGLLDQGGVAVVGSRDVDAAGQAFATAVGRAAAAAGLLVVSGGARGVDRAAMTAAVESGGGAVGVLADSLERWLRDPELRRAIHDEQLTLTTPFKPDAGFDVGNAMARNRVIYCLAECAVVVASSAEKGGTRAGALENLRHGWVPLFVRVDAEMPDGNRDLIDRGGISLDLASLDNGINLRTRLRVQAAHEGNYPQRSERSDRRSRRPVTARTADNGLQLPLIDVQSEAVSAAGTRRS